jgi:small subunit ribosomal protein S1
MKDSESMKDLLAKYGGKLIPIKAGELFEVKVLQVLRNRILVDVGGFSLGYIPEQEFSPDVDVLKVGDKVLAYVLTVENDDGYVILSLRRADKERISKILQTKFETGDILQVKTTSANKGGLLCQFGDYEGFLPVSQLASAHYPKVSSGDREEIFNRLKNLVGQTFSVKVLSFEPSSGKLIFSEKAAGDVVVQAKIKQLKIGEKLSAEITGIVNFGLFVKIQMPNSSDEIEGLVHISEASWDHVNDLNDIYKVGQKVNVSVISIENNRVSLSIKRLLPDPWLEAVSEYKVGQAVSGKITKITPYGAFVQAGRLDGLVHISELGEKIADPKEVIEEGKSYQFKIISIEPELHKLSLSLKSVGGKTKKAAPKKKAAKKVVTKEK